MYDADKARQKAIDIANGGQGAMVTELCRLMREKNVLEARIKHGKKLCDRAMKHGNAGDLKWARRLTG